MISVLNKIATTDHNSCEDAYILIENEHYLIAGVFDGCSTGKDSVFASHLFSKIMKEHYSAGLHPFIKEYVFGEFTWKLKHFAKDLALKENELWATIVLCFYDKLAQKLSLLIVGDGCYQTNLHSGLQIVDQNDQLDYIANHIDKTTKPTYHYEEFDGITDFLISSDGLKSYSLPQHKDSKLDPVQVLTSPNLSSNHLTRKYNMLKSQGWVNRDDITIISYSE